MSSIKNNRVDFVLDDTQISVLEKAFAQINQVLDLFAQPLSTEDRQTIPKMDVSNKAFVSDSIIALKANPGFLPAYLDPIWLDRDYRLYEQLESFLDAAKK